MCKCQKGKRVHELEDEITVAGGIDTVCSRSSENEIRSHGAAIQRERSSGHRSDPEGKDSLASGSRPAGLHREEAFRRKPAANAPPARVQHVASECKQASRHFRPARHDSSQLRTIQQDRIAIDQSPHARISEISRDLLITAAATVQLVSSFTDPRHQVLLNEVMHVLRVSSFRKSGEVVCAPICSSA